jgi:DNA polymerase-1
MARYIFDIECDNFLARVTKLHSLVLMNADTGEMAYSAHPGLEDGFYNCLSMLAEADEIIGHNVIAFDIPVLQKLYPSFQPKGKVTDTLVLSRLIHSDMKTEDAPRLAAKTISPKLYGRHSLEAWGERLGCPKGDYQGGFEVWSKEMQEYCEQDVRVTKKLLDCLKPDAYSQQAIQIEHEMTELCSDMEVDGWPFTYPLPSSSTENLQESGIPSSSNSTLSLNLGKSLTE